ncbi:hypothetical protein BO99DRAFT_202153 [Aspergillus violaceofuscus CBS 115571]|uniref:Secreted protein n=1 Tax=Aspergillus violaceofuscus (strain CBS 115571) TaxID=1450538 RepID=A0A2V5HG12_ASPV1|nr:hypothetical protein BO99DRAFT_202153 [Aspergillus violaceofuscus CBS 115571]
MVLEVAVLGRVLLSCLFCKALHPMPMTSRTTESISINRLMYNLYQLSILRGLAHIGNHSFTLKQQDVGTRLSPDAARARLYFKCPALPATVS